nr:reductive dehalogenase [uncultured bacterium]
MSKFHNTVSRRDFMKGLGLAGAGLGAAAATAPVFHDLDELASAPSAITKKPWWVKLVDKPTIPIDMSMIEPGRDRLPHGPRIYSDEETNQMFIDYFKKEQGSDWDPGPLGWGSVLNTALTMGSLFTGYTMFPREVIEATNFKHMGLVFDHPEGWRSVNNVSSEGPDFSWGSTTPITKWQGTPEENLRICRAAGRFYGFDDVGAIPIDDDFKKVMWKRGMTGTVHEWGDVDDFVITRPPNSMMPIHIVIPNKCKWFLSYAIRQPNEHVKAETCSLQTTQGPSQGYSYSNWGKVAGHMQEFLWNLGFLSLHNQTGSILPTGYTGVMAGMGELSRWSGVLTPKYGNATRCMFGFITDMPLAETKPVDFGAYEFCKTCGICADSCPMGAIETGEPSWEARYEWENSGYLGWRNDQTKCSHCPVCQGVCPFNSQDKSFIHQAIRGTISTTSVLNGFFTNMEKTFKYGRKTDEWWWDRAGRGEEPVGGFDTSL